MTDLELAALPIHQLAHPDGCWVLPWITSPMLVRALDVIRAWHEPGAMIRDRIKYSGRAFVWFKTHKKLNGLPPALFVHRDSLHLGQGYTIRKNVEDCLLFKYGKPKRNAKDIREPIFSPLREHSQKPEEAYERIERFADGPYADIFSRTDRRGWDSWGDEAGKFNRSNPEAAA
jgi:N6-adenosine-specific RNA methylase IME4